MKTITLQPWQITALQAGRLKSVWVPLDDTTARLWPVATLPYGVGDVVECVHHNREMNQFEFFRQTITSVTVRRVETITEQEARDAGCQDGLDAFYCQYANDHPDAGQWAVKVDLEECREQ